jgi:hypothetical protein
MKATADGSHRVARRGVRISARAGSSSARRRALIHSTYRGAPIDAQAS